MGHLPQPLSDEEIKEAATSTFRNNLADRRLRVFLNLRRITSDDALAIFRLGFMAGGEVATQRIQDYVDAGGKLEPTR
jgi:hypothetical protein